ncbi:TPA: hypothetical protein ACX3KG_006124, partial [Raoultella ornithinolytica]
MRSFFAENIKNMIQIAFMPRTKILHHQLTGRQRARICATIAAGLPADGTFNPPHTHRALWVKWSVFCSPTRLVFTVG